MKTTMKCHMRAMTQVMELLIIAGLSGLLADCWWVLKEISEQGFSGQYFMIALGLFSATLITMYAGYKHHQMNVRCDLKALLVLKLEAQKAVNRNKRNLAKRNIVK